jgi:hypothetical protein
MSNTDNEFDFGFSFSDDEVVTPKQPTAPAVNNDQIAALQSKIDSLLDAQEKAVEAAYIAAIEEKHKAKLKEVEGLILPLLYNLMKNPEKPIINWPNREAVIKKQIDKITAITRG